mmetsp:Transcript_33829/g.78116  ORF Transcript_33829/g.78116 Transcript_33829/m.78116 type:complete len:226 (-) Transcript_33829:33-710(-)
MRGHVDEPDDGDPDSRGYGRPSVQRLARVHHQVARAVGPDRSGGHRGRPPRAAVTDVFESGRVEGGEVGAPAAEVDVGFRQQNVEGEQGSVAMGLQAVHRTGVVLDSGGLRLVPYAEQVEVLQSGGIVWREVREVRRRQPPKRRLVEADVVQILLDPGGALPAASVVVESLESLHEPVVLREIVPSDRKVHRVVGNVAVGRAVPRPYGLAVLRRETEQVRRLRRR